MPMEYFNFVLYGIGVGIAIGVIFSLIGGVFRRLLNLIMRGG